MKRNRGQVEKAEERCREHMLTRMLLHVVAPAFNVDQTVNAGALLNRSCIFKNVEDLPVVSFRDLGYAQFIVLISHPGTKNPTRVKDLPSAGGIERSPIQNNGSTRVGIRRGNQIQHFRIKFAKKRVVVVETFGHIL